MQRLQRQVELAWYRPLGWNKVFLPLSWLFERLAKRRRDQFRTGQRAVKRMPVPVVVVGNVSVGGTGKSPLVIFLIEALRQKGWRPGVISRGYGAAVKGFPCQVRAEDAPSMMGDEPVMIVKRTGAPLVIDPDRGRAAEFLLASTACDVIISDDGLQHYALARDIEVAVVDGHKGLGNGCCLPVGPLREPPHRLESVDFVVLNQPPADDPLQRYPLALKNKFTMALKNDGVYPIEALVQEGCSPLTAEALGKKVHGVAGIGNPERFFASLRLEGFEVIEHCFPDHYQYCPEDLQFNDALAVVMTEKDAVKCVKFEVKNSYYLKVSSQVDASMMTPLWALLSEAQKKLV